MLFLNILIFLICYSTYEKKRNSILYQKLILNKILFINTIYFHVYKYVHYSIKINQNIKVHLL